MSNLFTEYKLKGTVHYEIVDSVALLTVDNPPVNPLSEGVRNGLFEGIANAEADENVVGVVVTGKGRAFIAGADISEFAHFSIENGGKLARKGQEMLFDLIENLSKPVIAAINGFALGGGLELAMSCHFRIASGNAKMGLPEVSLGVIPGYGGTQRLPQLVGKGKAMEMIMSAAMISAEEAKVVWKMDEEIDDEYLGILRQLLTYMMEDPKRISACTNLLYMVKDLERAGDYVQNIAEDIYYAVSGEPLYNEGPDREWEAIKPLKNKK